MKSSKERDEKKGRRMGAVVQIDTGEIQQHVDEVVRDTVEETLNAMLEAEADRLCQAQRLDLPRRQV